MVEEFTALLDQRIQKIKSQQEQDNNFGTIMRAETKIEIYSELKEMLIASLTLEADKNKSKEQPNDQD